LLAAACSFTVGIAMARTWQPALILSIEAILLSALVLLALRRSPRFTLLPLAALWIASGFWCWQMRPVPSQQHALAQYADGLSRNVQGRVLRVRELPPQKNTTDQDDDPVWWIEKEPEPAATLAVDLAVEAVEEVTPDVSLMLPVTGGVRAIVVAKDTAIRDLHCGDVLEMPLRLRVPERFRDPGAWQYADYLLQQRMNVHATVHAAKVRTVGAHESSLQCRLFAAQSSASAQMLQYQHSKANRRLPGWMRLTEDDAGMLNAMLFGDRTRLNRNLRLGFERTGSFHLFVVSGMHVALLGGILFWLLRRMRIRDWLATLVTLPLMTAYALLTGFGAPVQRALFMTTIFLIARLLSRERSVLNALGAAALAELVWSPASLFEASFQMTFLAIVAIAGIAVPLGERSFMVYSRASRNLNDLWRDPVLAPNVAQFRVMLRMWGEAIAAILGRWAYGLPALLLRNILFAAELALIGVVAEMVMALPMAMYFHRATIFALPANMLTVPVVSLLAPMAVILFCISLIAPWASILPGAATAMMLHGIAWVIVRVSHVQAADLRVPAPAWWIALVAIAAWAFSSWAVRHSRPWSLVAVALLPVVTVMVLWPEPILRTQGELEVTALDVGQGDSLLAVSPNGQTMLIDAGGPVGGPTEAAATTSAFDVGEEVVSPYLWSRRIRHLDVLALSHAHSDHMGGMAAVMRNFRPRELWVAVDPDSDAYRELLAEAADLGVTVRHLRAGSELEWGGTKVKVLAPETNYFNSGEPVNNDSLALRIEFGEASALLEGDAEAPSEQAMIAHGLSPVTLLKVGHHGSRSSTTPDFFAALAPKDAVVSVGKGNTFGHPRFEVIERIAARGTRLYRTDEFGLTTFLLRRDGTIREITGTSD
jgi:ComEC/Rec2-related protein